MGALIVRAQPAFEAIKWAGVCYLAYLAYLGVQALRSAVCGRYAPIGDGSAGQGRANALAG